MRLRLLFFLSGLLVCVALAVAWARLRAEVRALDAEQRAVKAAILALKANQHVVEQNSARLQVTQTAREQAVVMLRSPSDRARATVGPLVARLKADHALHPPPPRRLPPPVAADGSGFFPELMRNPDYNAGYAAVTKRQLASWEQPRLSKLGVPDEMIDKVLDVLTDRDVGMANLRSLAGGSYSLSGDDARQAAALQTASEAQVKALLGPELYQRDQDESRPLFGSAPQKLELRLSYSDEPLTAAQRDQVIALLTQDAAERAARHGGPLPGFSGWSVFGPQAPTSIDGLSEPLQKILSPRQFAALLELQDEADASNRRSHLPQTAAPGTR